jgi:hypothetical protein
VAATFAVVSVTLIYIAPAVAANDKTWVSNTGSDANDCHDTAHACRTFSRAFSQTTAGGEISVLDAGDYGPLNITHAINITNDAAAEVGLLNIDGTCPGFLMTISASTDDVISLRGLVFEGCVSGLFGISFAGGAALHIQNCVFRNFEADGANGLVFQPTGASRLFISDSILFNNGSTANTAGILIQPQGTASADVVIERVQLEDNVVGLRLDGATLASGGNGIHTVLRDSVVSGNAADGISVFTQSGKAPAFVSVQSSASVSNGGNGIIANGSHAVVLLSDSTITRNGTGVSAINSGQLISYGNNRNNNNVGAEGTATGFLSANF